MSDAIKIDNLVKSYGANTVIKGASFVVKTGEIFALLGINGAGKTTMLQCIEGILKYDSGVIDINGNIGVQLQSSSLPASIKTEEAFRLFCKWNKVPINLEILNTFDLSKLKNKQYKELSTGQKRRLHLALCLIGNPDIVFLDEPTAGLDVEGRISLHSEIRKLKQLGKTIIMASHDMAEVESLCDRIAIIKDGVIAFVGTPNELTSKIGEQNKIHIKSANVFDVQGLQSCKFDCIQSEYSIFTATNISDALLELLQKAKQRQNDILDVKIEHVSLEQRFIDIAKIEEEK